MSVAEEQILDFPSPVRPLRAARSSVLIAAIAALRDTPRWNGYLAALPPQHHSTLLQAIAGTWIPLPAALAHYHACESLGFPVDEEVQNGRQTLARSGDLVFGTAIKMSKAAGVTPWTVLPQAQRFWDRAYDGGGVAVVKTGPKDARIDVISAPLVNIRYFRNALRGVWAAAIALYASKVYLTERPGPRADGTASFRVQWA